MSCTVGGGLQRRVKRYAGESERGRTSMVQVPFGCAIHPPSSIGQSSGVSCGRVPPFACPCPFPPSRRHHDPTTFSLEDWKIGRLSCERHVSEVEKPGVASGSCRGLVYGRWSVVGGRSSASGSGIARLPGLALSTLASPIFTKSPSPIHETEASYQTPTSLLSSPKSPTSSLGITSNTLHTILSNPTTSQKTSIDPFFLKSIVTNSTF
jgi:hypothetical protein